VRAFPFLIRIIRTSFLPETKQAVIFFIGKPPASQ